MIILRELTSLGELKNPGRIDDFRRTDYSKKIENFGRTGDLKRTDEISWCKEISWFGEDLWIEEMSWFGEISWIGEISWFGDISWLDETSWFGEISLSWEISWSEQIFWFETAWFDEISWVEKISRRCEISWYKGDPEKLSPGLLNFSKMKREEKIPNLEPVRCRWDPEKDELSPGLEELNLKRQRKRFLEGNGIDLEMSSNFTKILDRNRSIYQQWYQMFIDNIHLLNLRPNKWLKSDRLPLVDNIVLFVFNDGNFPRNRYAGS